MRNQKSTKNKTSITDHRACAIRLRNLPDSMKASEIFQLLKSKNLFSVLDLKIETKWTKDKDDTERVVRTDKILPEFVTQSPSIILGVESDKNNTNYISDILESMENNGSCMKTNFPADNEKYRLDILSHAKSAEIPPDEEEEIAIENIDMFLDKLRNMYKLIQATNDGKIASDFDWIKNNLSMSCLQNDSREEEAKKFIKNTKASKQPINEQFLTAEKRTCLLYVFGCPEKLSKEFDNYKIYYENSHPLYLHYTGLKFGISTQQELRIAQLLSNKKSIPCQNIQLGVINPNNNREFLSYWNLLKIRRQNDGINLTYLDLDGKPSKRVEIIFELPSLSKFVKVEFSFKLSENIHLEHNESKQLCLYFELTYPPRFSVMSYDDIIYRNFMLSEQWERISHFAFNDNDDSLFTTYLVQSTVVKVLVEKTQNLKRLLEIIKSTKRGLQEHTEEYFYETDITQKMPYLTFEKLNKLNLSYEIKYGLLACVTTRKINLFQLKRKFLKSLEKLVPETVEKTLKDIANNCRRSLSRSENVSTQQIESLFQELYEDNLKSPLWNLERNLAHIVRTKRVTITPTQVVYHIEEAQLSNSVLREYSKHEKRFLRITITDEMGEGVKNMRYVSERIFKPLLKNFQILNMKYQFLAFSSSQLRSNSLWMFSETEDLTISIIHQSIGDFSSINNVAKYGSRLGQLFSASFKVLNMNDEKIKISYEDDIYSQNSHKYIFSDGVGKISMNLLDQIKVKMRLKGVISAIQIRCGGVKGVLVGDPLLAQNRILFRQSMVKFQKTNFDKTLELLDFSKYRSGYLNRQIIMLLLTNGLDPKTLEILQEENIRALNFKDISDGSIFAYINNEHYLSPTKDLLQGCANAKIDFSKEPFIKGVVNTIRIRSFMNLKEKCNLLVRKSAKLMGVLDEYNYLESGQVFISVSESNGDIRDDLQVIGLQKVIVTKNPCLHPGDVRVLEAVDTLEARTKFKHLLNCIVFPAKGERPHTDEISGSDLDGDIYFVCWDKRLIPPKISTPMNYSKRQAPTQNVKADDIVDFFIEHANNDILGRIDNSHLALADNAPNLAKNSQCLSLAELHSIAVDYPKNGICPSLKRVKLARLWPDYMEKTPDVTFESSSIMGSLYRDVKSHIEKLGIKEDYKQGFKIIDSRVQIDQDLIVDGFEEHLEEAFDILEVYYKDINALMNLYGIQTEYEIYSGNFLMFMTKVKKVNIEKLQEKIIDHIGELKEKFISILLNEFDDESKVRSDDGRFTNAIEKKCSALYIATYFNKDCKIERINNAMNNIHYNERREPYFEKYDFQMLGLPWHIFKDVIFQIKKGSTKSNK